MKLVTKLLLGPMARVGRPYLNAVGLLQTHSLFAASTVVWDPTAARVLVLAPHMDDETIGCGGALARHAIAGAHITVVFFTDGRYGDPALAGLRGEARQQRERAIVALRKDEARSALAVLGVNEHHFLDERDGSLSSTPKLAARLRELLDTVRPDLIYLPFFMDQHPDHKAVTEILRDATVGLKKEMLCLAYEIWAPLWPNCLVRIDDVLDTKRRALLEYRSQVEHCDYVHHSLGLNAYRSVALNDGRTRHAEAFCMLPLERYLTMTGAALGRGEGTGAPTV